MTKYAALLTTLFLLALSITNARADKYTDTIKVFKGAGQSASFFDKSYGYVIFPTIGKGGFGIGGAYGEGRVYKQNVYVGDATMTQVSFGFQMGGQAFSQIIFFQDKRALNEFINGNFEFGASASAVAITAGAQASTSTTGSSVSASGGQNDAKTIGQYFKGMATFTVAKGGLMYEASVGGQKFNYTAK